MDFHHSARLCALPRIRKTSGLIQQTSWPQSKVLKGSGFRRRSGVRRCNFRNSAMKGCRSQPSTRGAWTGRSPWLRRCDQHELLREHKQVLYSQRCTPTPLHHNRGCFSICTEKAEVRRHEVFLWSAVLVTSLSDELLQADKLPSQKTRGVPAQHHVLYPFDDVAAICRSDAGG